MALLTVDLFESLAITQGYEWKVTLLLPGDLRGSQIVGRIYNRYGGNELRSFRDTVGEYIPDLNKTRFVLSIPPSLTAALPLTGSGYWVYNVRLDRFGVRQTLLLAGKVRVNPSLP
jgi:hypothetical protein